MRRPILSDGVYEEIFAGIVAGEFPERSRLPPEVELCSRFHVSRPVVREALSRLRADGVVVSRRGSGTYVQRRPSSDVLRFTALSSIADMQRCFEYRIGLEGEIAALAAERHNVEALARIDQAMDRLNRAIVQTELGVDADFALHLAIADATENGYYQGALASLRDSVAVGMNLARNLSLLKPRQRLEQVQQEHIAIVAAITARDAGKARRLMRQHVSNAKIRVFEGPEAAIQEMTNIDQS